MAVLLALGMSSARKSRMNYFIKHLAIAGNDLFPLLFPTNGYCVKIGLQIVPDLSVGVISVLTDIVWKITVAWHAGNIACKVIRFSQVIIMSYLFLRKEKKMKKTTKITRKNTPSIHRQRN